MLCHVQSSPRFLENAFQRERHRNFKETHLAQGKGPAAKKKKNWSKRLKKDSHDGQTENNNVKLRPAVFLGGIIALLNFSWDIHGPGDIALSFLKLE